MKQEIKRTSYSFNQRHIKIKRCCASCQLKCYLEDYTRVCTLSDQKVKATNRCEKWVMSDGLRNAGRGSGKVKDFLTKEVILH